MTILYVPEMAHRFGMTVPEYWRDCAAKWDKRADSGLPEWPRLESLIEADWCRGRADDKPAHTREIPQT